MTDLRRLPTFAQDQPGLLSIWRNRIVLRRALRHMLATNPHLIPDIGLTRKEAEREIAKRFWQR